MPIHHAVLALLRDAPSYGYELRARFEETVGPQWGGLNIGHLYQVLERLQRDGLATSRAQAQASRPDRVFYAVTPVGVAEVDTWLAQPVPRAAGYRDEFFLKLAAARLAGRPQLDRLLRTQRQALLAEVRDVMAARAASGGLDPVARLLLVAAENDLRARLLTLDAVEDDLGELERHAASPAVTDAAGDPPGAIA